MLHSPLQPSNYSLRIRRKSDPQEFEGNTALRMADAFDDDMDGGGGDSDEGKGRSKSRRELPAGAVATLKAWLLSPEHFTHPYPTPQDQAMLMQKTGIDKKQLKNWFTNARRRIWKPMLKKQIESGKLTPNGVPGGLIVPGMAGANPVAGTGMDNPHSIQAMRVHYQQASQQQEQPQQPQQVESYPSSIYTSAPAPALASQYYVSQNQDGNSSGLAAPNAQMTKTDSHAVLMELFARDQDLVRRATESAQLKAESKQHVPPQAQAPVSGQQQAGAPGSQPSSQHPMRTASAGPLQTVPSLSSWPQFSSISSLNNLTSLPGVKSITSLSGVDLANKGSVNKMANLAQVKSFESMGKNDSYAFLEVFFGDRSASNLSSMGGVGGKGMKSSGGGDEDNEIGLSLEDESPQQVTKNSTTSDAATSQPSPSPSAQDPAVTSGTLKRAYDDALAARGLISVSRSSERLTDLVLPAKIQRTLSQEFIKKEQDSGPQPYSQYAYTSTAPAPASTDSKSPMPAATSQQYPGQQPDEPQGSTRDTSDHVEVPTETKCSMCGQTDVDTQLRPCGHLYHERCLKPSLQNPRGQPKCPIDDIPMQSAVLAVPTDDATAPQHSAIPASTSTSSWSYTNL